MNIDFLLLQKKDLDRSQIERISRLKMQYWSYPLEEQIRWINENSAITDHHLLGYDAAGDLAGYLRITKRHLIARDLSLIGNGIGTVCVDGKLQRRGIGRKLMEQANAHVSAHPGEIGFLSCGKTYVDFYQACGWALHRNCFYRSDNEPRNKKKFFNDPYVLVFPGSCHFSDDVFVGGERF